MILKDLINPAGGLRIPPDFWDREITGISCDSRTVREGNLFVALPGPKTHGDLFIKEAMSRGASVIAQESEAAGAAPNPGVCFLKVKDIRAFFKNTLLCFYQDPSARVRVTGITGTNGKTTITYLLESIFAAAGKNCGVIGTINHRHGGKIFEARNTTPGIVDNYIFLAEMSREGGTHCAMEVSSHALVQGRVDGIDFKTAVFTNLTSDHLDYHQTREEYFLAKSLLFTGLRSQSCAVINADDEYGKRLASMTQAIVRTYGIKNKSDVMAVGARLGFSGSTFQLVCPEGEIEIQTTLIGPHNIYNILAAAGVVLAEQIPLDKIREGVERLRFVPGRLERICCGQDFYVFVDYAHTEDALKNVLSSLKDVSAARIIVVFGCGGDRDKTKRPKMGEVAGELADMAIVTTDNPRSEDPDEIIAQIARGFKRGNYQVVVNRHEAIAAALDLAGPGDVVLIAGKGHEDYQIFKDKTIDFNERDIVREALLRQAGVKRDS